jgi:hypothetical protein
MYYLVASSEPRRVNNGHLVCSCPPSSSVYLDWQGWTLPNSAAHWRADVSGAQTGRRCRRCKFAILPVRSFYVLPLSFEQSPVFFSAVSNVEKQTIAISFTNKVASRSSDLQGQARALGTTLSTCIEKYQGLSLNKRTLRYAQRAAVAA